MIKVETDRIRQKEALERAKQNVLTNMLQESLITKQQKLHYSDLASLRKQADYDAKQMQTEKIKEDKVQGAIRKE